MEAPAMTDRCHIPTGLLDHDPGGLHPERRPAAGRCWSARRRVAASSGARCAEAESTTSPGSTPAALSSGLLARGTGHRAFGIDADHDPYPGIGRAALRAGRGGGRRCRCRLGGQADNAFCAVRPPGHHARTGRAMGFCLFNKRRDRGRSEPRGARLARFAGSSILTSIEAI